jgi:hypothetical protein
MMTERRARLYIGPVEQHESVRCETDEQIRDAVNDWARRVYFGTGKRVTADDFRCEPLIGDEHYLSTLWTVHGYELAVRVPILKVIDGVGDAGPH